MSAFTEGRHRALTAMAFLIVALSRPTVSEAQTRRDSLVNPGQSGPQGIVGGQPGPSVGRTQPSFGVLPSIDFGPADPSNLKVPRIRTAQDLPLPLDPDPQRPRPGLPALKPFFGKPDGITLDMAVEILLHNSLDLAQSRGDISQAEADLITAGLRTNPIVRTDSASRGFFRQRIAYFLSPRTDSASLSLEMQANAAPGTWAPMLSHSPG